MAVFFEDDAFGTVPESYEEFNPMELARNIFTTEEGRARRDAKRTGRLAKKGSKTEGRLSEADLKRAMAEDLRRGEQKDNTLLIVGIAAILVIGGVAAFALMKRKK